MGLLMQLLKRVHLKGMCIFDIQVPYCTLLSEVIVIVKPFNTHTMAAAPRGCLGKIQQPSPPK